MSHKTTQSKQTESKKSKLIVPSRILQQASSPDEIEETEIAAEVSIPAEGGWGWVVVAASFISAFILDGVFFTFGSIYPDIVQDLETQTTLVTLINSLAVALYFIMGPVTSALINRFGFRKCTMCGAILIAFSYLVCYFSTSYMVVLIFYGIIAGFGGCLIAMPSAIIVGFYFERLRALALAIAGTGSSLGITVLSFVNAYLVDLVGWRIVTLIHSGLFGMIYFLGMTYRPLLSITVTQTTDDPTRTVTYLPNLSTAQVDRLRPSISRTGREGVKPTAAERLFSAVSNVHFPTAASVVEESAVAQQPVTTQAGPSSAGTVSKLTLTARSPQGGISRRQLKQVQSIVSRASRASVLSDKKNVELTVQVQGTTELPMKKRGFWARLCHWEEHIAESRPMYRDDAFYDGRIEKLPVYQKSMMDTPPEARTGLEYQLAVSRAVTTADLEERRGIFTTAVRRILATMMDPKLLKRKSFLVICLSGFLTYVGLLIPYVFLPARNKYEGVAPEHCNLFVSVIGMCTAVGRLIAGTLACKYNPLTLYLSGCAVAGVATMAYNFSNEVYYQYFCCIIFGLFIASCSSLRSMVLVDLYGLDRLTNATGMLLLFQGFGTLISTPGSSILISYFGYTISFYLAGLVILLSGLVLIPVRSIVAKENKSEKDHVNVKPKLNK